MDAFLADREDYCTCARPEGQVVHMKGCSGPPKAIQVPTGSPTSSATGSATAASPTSSATFTPTHLPLPHPLLPHTAASSTAGSHTAASPTTDSPTAGSPAAASLTAASPQARERNEQAQLWKLYKLLYKVDYHQMETSFIGFLLFMTLYVILVSKYYC